MSEPDEEQRKHRAARIIQRKWRSRQSSRAREKFMSSGVRWKDAAVHAKMKVDREAADEGKNHPRDRWNRAVFFVSQMRNGNAMLKDNSGVESNQNVHKHLETQHWLELVDGRWQDADTEENFFKWYLKVSTCFFYLRSHLKVRLDQGGGKNLSLDECSRDQLEKEVRVQASSITFSLAFFTENNARLNYLVDIDNEGKLRWARNNELVDTTPGHWKDSGDGSGVVPEDFSEQNRPQPRPSFESVSSSSASSVDSNAATHYVDQTKGRHAWSRALRRYFTVRGLLNRLLRKTVRRNTWIWVTDRNYNLFVGIKDTGSFQHSSFLAGGLVTSAGLITIKNGMVHTLSPLSGHYRTSVGHFHQFIDKMAERGLDMDKAKISKAEAALWGIEHIAKWKKKQSELASKGKEKAIEAGQDVAVKLPLVNESWKREVLEGRKKAKPSTGDSEGKESNGESSSKTAERKLDSEDPKPAVESKESNDESSGKAAPVEIDNEGSKKSAVATQ
ncbi:hypothetical protein V5O48_006154 [Marasmius crinis-equi]|uniref:Uncharacterized protein n=1 Tax=Marasmius crinis-equi TaxID=585013 RepID=A0ABR3FKA1_9AGAR